MKDENFKYQMIAIQALYEKYGFCPAPQQVTLLESDGEGTYILFKVNGHEYRCDNGMILDIEDGKKNDGVIDEYFQMYFEALKGKNAMEYQSKQQTKRINELRFENRELKDANKQLNAERDDLKKTIHYRELALDEAAKKRDELETKNRQLCNDLAGERWTIRTLKGKLEESQRLADQWFEEAQKNQVERDKLKAELDEWKTGGTIELHN